MITTRTLLFGSAAITAFVLNTNVRADDLAAAAAKASAAVNRPIAASPHALEEFPWVQRGGSLSTEVRHPVETNRTYPENFASPAAKASALVNRPIVASPHGLEEFPWLLRGGSPPFEVRHPAPDPQTYPGNLAAAAAKASALVNRPIVASPHGLEEFPWLQRGYSPPAVVKNPTQGGQLSSTNAPAVAPTTVRN
jgi:hypothetical protein